MNRALMLSILVVAMGSSVIAAQNYNYEQQTVTPTYNHSVYPQENYKLNETTLKGRIVTVPAGEQFRAVMTAPVTSETAIPGQTVTMALGSDFYYKGNLIAPAGSSVTGTVIQSSKAKHGSVNGKLTLRFTEIITPNGQTIPISAVIKTDDNTGVLIGGTKVDVAKDYVKDLTLGAGAGALAGVIISPLAGGSIGRGTALATAVGAGGGLAKSIWDKGSDVEIPINAMLELFLTQPITVNPNNSEN